MATVFAAAVMDLFLVKKRCNRLCGVSVWSAGDADRTLAGILPDDLFANSVSLQLILTGARGKVHRFKSYKPYQRIKVIQNIKLV